MQIEETLTSNLNSDNQIKYDHVMLIDDNAIDNLVSKQLMEKHNFAKMVSIHEGAISALDALTSSSHNELPGLILLDIMMPEMDGFEFLDAFEKLDARITDHCKIVMLSTSDSFTHLNKANKNKFVRRFLNKPLTEKMMNAIIL